MAADDPKDLNRIDQEIRINETKERLREKSGGEMTSWEDPNLPLDVQDNFWQSIEAFENAPGTCEHEKFRRDAIELPPPEELSDEELHQKLWEVIQTLARRNTTLYHTDHLSDRELYAQLVEDVFWEGCLDLPEELTGPDGYHSTLDLTGSGSEEDIEICLTYYYDDEERADWLKSFPDYVLPEKKPKPYDRDRLLPVSKHEQERRAWLEGMYAQGYTDEDINRMAREEMERDEEEDNDGGPS